MAAPDATEGQLQLIMMHDAVEDYIIQPALQEHNLRFLVMSLAEPQILRKHKSHFYLCSCKDRP